jgi:hypothetical protein
MLKKVPRTEGWGRMEFKDIPDIEKYRGGWHRIREFLPCAQGDQATNKAPSDL